ncbi:hypothetical protein [Streptomyces palmae]|uniref:Uncharacterized protein n=1 Tax=Streptomyces palmae TaxID=1701085 RepID=A0A4Z0H813_9ACTN|nr:hypothetical protein [Streptomyces palmae]TGB11621.1 hypothetical protein E4099_11770 [Streptomyces palmae]
MQSNNQPHTHQDPDQQQEPPTPDTAHRPSRWSTLRTWWDGAWGEGGVLHHRWEQVRQARTAGWHGMATWIKALLGLAAACVIIILLDTAGDIVSALAHQIATANPQAKPAPETSNSLWAVIDNPARTYIAQHTGSHLAVTGSAVYSLWQITGLFGLIGGFFHSTGARLTWTLWGAATIGMVWSATPTDSRTITTGIAALAWTATSTIALRGLSLRPVIYNTPPAIQPRIDIRPQIHVPPQSTPSHDEPTNIHPFRR